MRHKLPQRDPIKADQRNAIAERCVGIGKRCACGEARPEAFIAGSDPLICAACDRKRRGKAPLDNHRVAGKSNSSVTIPVPVNDHRAILSSAQYDWPKTTLENSEASPFLAAAAYIRGLADTVSYLVGQLVWVADMLETAHSLFDQKLGSKWWRNTKLKRFEPKSR
jgi:hypothetical protein